MDARIKKLEEKIRDLKEQQEEFDANIEDIYQTINELKYPETHSNLTENNITTTKTISKSTNNSTNNTNLTNYTHNTDNADNINIDNLDNLEKNDDYEDILEYINNVISVNADKYPPYIKREVLTFLEYMNKNHFQPGGKTDINLLKENIKYFLGMDDLTRVNILQQYENIHNHMKNSHNKPKLFTILETSLSEYHKQLALNKLQHLEKMEPSDPEYFKLSQWLDNLLQIPFNTIIEPTFLKQSPQHVLTNARTILDNVIFGQYDTKQHILELLGKIISNPQGKGSVFAVEGTAGTGKTTLIKDGFSKIFGLPFVFISLGGAQDGTILTGDNYTYIGSKPGRIVQALKEAKCLNPIFYFDELDKVSNTERGVEIINILIHLTDFSQNSQFIDYYMDGITLDLSRATFIFSFNDRNLISPILLDRMEIIKFNPYNNEEKKQITMNYLLPKVIKKYYGEREMKVRFKNKKDKFLVIDKLVRETNPPTQLYIPQHLKQIHQHSQYTPSLNSNNYKIRDKLNGKTFLLRKYLKGNGKRFRRNVNNITSGGVRYIERRLDRLIARINIQNIEKGVNNNHININSKIVDNILAS